MALWNAEYVPGKIDGCSQALTQGLRCLNQRGSFAQLRLLNRPAILMLSDDNGTAYQVVLRSLHEDMAQLQIGTQAATVGVAELARYWFGDFVLLWRPGTRDVRDLSQGMHGALVRHLRDEAGLPELCRQHAEGAGGWVVLQGAGEGGAAGWANRSAYNMDSELA